MTQRSLLGALAARVLTPGVRAAAGKLLGPLSPVEEPRPLSQQYLFVGVQTPDDVASLMRLADTGYLYRLCDYWEEQRNRDCHLGTVVYRREHAVAPLSWQMVPASDRRRDLKIAAWVEDVLRRMGDIEHRECAELGLTPKSFADLTVHLNGGNFHGYAGAEIPWAKVEGRVVPVGGLPMHPRRFIYSQLDGSLRWWDATGGPKDNKYPGKDLLRDFAPGRFMVHRPRVNGAVGPREGLWRPLLWASLFRTWAIGDWLKLAELAWKPYRWGEYDANTGRDDKVALENALQKLIATGWASLPERTKLHIEYAKGNAQGEGQHAALCAFLGAEMSKLVLGATLTVEQGKTGAMALGNVHENVARDLRDIDARALEATVQRQLIGPLVRANFGNVPLPHFVFVTEEAGDLKLIAEAIEKLRGEDGTLPGISMRWIRQLLGAPEPDVGEEMLDGTAWPGPPKLGEEPQEQTTPAEEPEEESANDNEPPANEKAMAMVLRNYRVHHLLCDAGVRMRRAA